MSHLSSQATRCQARTVLQFIIELLLPLLLLAGKLYALNTDMLRLGVYTWPMLCGSLVIVGALCCLIRLVLRRDHLPFFMVLYSILSVFMLIDAVYCGYTGKLPSAVMLQYTGQLSGVKEAIFQNVTFARLLYAIDIPLWILYFTHVRRTWFGADGYRRQETVKTAVLAGMTALCLCVCIAFCIFTPFAPSYFKNEILTYHVTDFASLLWDGDKPLEIPVFSETEPDYRDEQEDVYHGLAAGRNVITIQVEALQNFVIGLSYDGQVITPNLNALVAGDSLYFDHYYYQIGGGNTADAEFAVNNSLYAPINEAAYSRYAENDFYSMATLLKDNGWGSATAFHGYDGTYWNRNVAYPGQGFDLYLSGSDYYAAPDEVAGMGVSDGEFFVRAVDYLKTQTEPFYAFMITLTSHYAFELPAQYNTLNLRDEHVGTLFGNYLQAVHYFDFALGQLIDALKAAGLYDNTILTLYGDHFGLPVYDWRSKMFMTELLGVEYTYAEHFNVPLIVHIPGSGVTETHSVAGGHIDVMPTLLHLLGLENKKGIMFGESLLRLEKNVVCQQQHLERGSFISDDVFYQFPFSGIEINATANVPDTWEVLDAAQYRDISRAAKDEIERCMYLLDYNLVLIENYLAATQPQKDGQ
ncbi:MAG: LTA synthase family protein [Clostridia bacterium]|nr:LTA synthase family protein [Clostridia bacterium]